MMQTRTQNKPIPFHWKGPIIYRISGSHFCSVIFKSPETKTRLHNTLCLGA